MIDSASLICIEPAIQAGVSTGRLLALNTSRTTCCRIRLTPNVASKVSSGRPYRKRTTPRSISMPTQPDTRNASGIATSIDAPMWLGISCCTT